MTYDPIAVVLRASFHQFEGRLGQDPKIRYFDGGTCVANSSLAVNRLNAERDTPPDWFKLEVWDDCGAQEFADQVQKGDLVHVSGRIKTDTWTDKATGEIRKELTIKVRQWRVVQENPQQPARSAAAPAAAPTAPAPAPAPSLQSAVAANTQRVVDYDIPF